MSGYRPPKTRLHREFLYLNHDTVLNSLSALEAGKVDEIIQKVSEAKEGGAEAALAAGPVRGGGGKKKRASIEEELVKTRTWFSAFEAWHAHLKEEEAIGTFDSWDMEVRQALGVGDTLEFTADLVVSPLHKLFRSFLAFAKDASRPGTQFSQKGAELAETKATAKLMTSWLSDGDRPTHLPVYLQPDGVPDPRVVTMLEDAYLVGGYDKLEGTYTVVGQVSALLSGDDVESVVRLIRDVPPTALEVQTITEAMMHFIEPAEALGVQLEESDITFTAPAVMVRPIAIFQ